MSKGEKPVIGWAVALVLMPALLAVATVGAVYWKIRAESRTGPDARLALAAAEVNPKELRELHTKLAEFVGRRDWKTVEGRTAIRRAIAFIDGTLSPQNYGFVPVRGGAESFADELWPTVWADLAGTEESGGVVVVAVPYDRGDFPVAALLAVANDLRDEEVRRTVRFVFYPAVLLEKGDGASFLANGDERVRTVLCVNSLASREESLWLTDGQSGGRHPSVTRNGLITTLDGEVGGVSAEKAVFGVLEAPVYVCRGGPAGGEETGAMSEADFDRFLTRTILLRNLIRDLAQVGAKRP